MKKEFENHELTEDQVAARIIMLRKKPTLPEDLQGDNIAEIMDFSPEYLSRYEEQFKQNQNELKEKDVLIETLKADSQKVISEKDATIISQEGIIKQKDDENAELRGKLKEYQHTNAENTELRGQLEEYRRKEGEAARKKERRKNKWKLAWHIFWRISIIAIFTAVVIVCERKFNFTIPAPVYTAVNALGLLALFWKDIKETWKKYLPKPDSTADKDS